MRSRCSATSAFARRSGRTAAGRSTGRPATSFTSRSTPAGARSSARLASSHPPALHSSIRRSAWSAARAAAGRTSAGRCSEAAPSRGRAHRSSSCARAEETEPTSSQGSPSGKGSCSGCSSGPRTPSPTPRAGRQSPTCSRSQARARRRCGSTSTPSWPPLAPTQTGSQTPTRQTSSAITKAAHEQLQAIRQLEGEALPSKLQEIADLRVRHPWLSLTELAAKCRPPITKAAAHHRMKVLRELAEAERGTRTR